MKNVPAANSTHNFKAPENWNEETDGECFDLHIRAGVHGDRKLLTWTSAWRPTEEELAKLMLGGEIEITLVGHQPPMQVNVVMENATPPAERPHITINEEAHGLS